MKLTSRFFYLFDMTNGKKKLAYGIDAQDAWEILAMRLPWEELRLVVKDSFKKIAQTDIQKVRDQLG